MFLVITSTAKLEHTYGQNQKQVLKISEQKIKEEEQRNFFKIPSSLLLQYNTKSKNRVPKNKTKKKKKKESYMLNEITKINRLTATGHAIPFFMYGF